jgi:uncharacterized Rmd1/YagE family protein
VGHATEVCTGAAVATEVVTCRDRGGGYFGDVQAPGVSSFAPAVGADRISIEARLVGERLDLRRLVPDRERKGVLAIVRGESGGIAVAFRYGAVVLCGVESVDREALLQRIEAVALEPHRVPPCEAIEAEVGAEDAIGAGGLVVRDLSPERLVVVADVMAKSVILEDYESRIREVFDQTEALAEDLEGGRGTGRVPDLLRHIGRTLRVQQRMAWRVEVAEKPDILWDRPDLERLHQRLSDEYEIRERHAALERKLGLIARTAETILELLWTRRSLRVEWYIVALIVVEIVLTLYTLAG